MRIALFVTCLADALFPQAAIATVELLERLGHDVVFPPGQTCCGQMHVNTGYLTEATALVRRHVEEFETAGCDAVVAPSGSCVGSVRHQHAMVARSAGNPDLARDIDLVRRDPYGRGWLYEADGTHDAEGVDAGGYASILDTTIDRMLEGHAQ